MPSIRKVVEARVFSIAVDEGAGVDVLCLDSIVRIV